MTGPNIVGDITDKLELVDHAVPINGITHTVGSKSTLRTDTDLIKRSFERNVIAFGNVLGSVDDTPLHLLHILELGELAGDDTEYDILMGGKELKRLEATRARGIVFQVVGVHVELLEKLNGDAIIATLREVTATDEVAAAQVDTDVHVNGQVEEAVVVLLDVLFEHDVGAIHIQSVILKAVEEFFGAEV